MIAFALFALCLMTLFTLYALAFAYTVEDAYLNQGLAMEAERQRTAQSAGQGWLRPTDPNTELLIGDGDFPPVVVAGLADNPKRREFAGEQGLHYHLLQIRSDPEPVWLLAEVSDRLVFRQMRAGVAKIIGWSAGMAMLAALLIGWLVARRTTEPLSRLVDAVAAVEPGQLPENLALQPPGKVRDDEVGILSDNLNRMVKRLLAFVEREREFTRDVSHELRTPLTVIRSASERMASDPTLSASAQRQLDAVKLSTARLEQVIDTLLELAREARPTKAVLRTPLLPAMEQVIIEQTQWHDDRTLDLQIEVDEQTAVAIEDGVLHVLLSNLIGNAISHAEAGADERRLVRIRTEDGRLWISNPSRAGIDEADFESLRKGPESTGFGLGLSIVQRLCRRHGIDLQVAYCDGEVRVGVPVRPPPA